MTELTATRTLVKSPPELWAQCSDPESLARHLQAFGEIKITRLEPEETVAWEGERARGTVRLEPSGWGTKVTLTADGPVAVEPVAAVPEPTTEAQPEAARRGLLARLFGRRPEPPATAEAPPPQPAPAPVVPGAPGVLDAALDSLGQAHHRPFSRN
jgi:hypothetical protein